jgi:hypothetical protein
MANSPLQLTFQSDTTAARNDIANLAGAVVKNMVTIGDAMKTAANHSGDLQKVLGTLPGIARTAFAAFLGFEAAKLVFSSLAGSIEGALEKLKELVSVGQGARDAGVGTDFFQRWTAHAGELNTTTEKLAQTLKNARTAAEVSIGEGGEPNQSPFQSRLAEHLKAGNISKEDIAAYNAVSSVEEKSKVVIDLIEKMNREGKALTALDLGKAFFGPDIEKQLREGTTALSLMRKDLEGIGQVKWPPELVKRAEDLNRELELAKKNLGDAAHTLSVDMASSQLDVVGYVRDWYKYLTQVVEVLDRAYKWVNDIATRFDEISNSATFREIKQLGYYFDKLESTVARAGENAGVALGLRKRGIVDPELAGIYATPDGSIPGERELKVRVGTKTNDKPLPKKDTKESNDEIETYINNLKKSVEVLKAENETFNLSNTAKAQAVDMEKLLAAARSAGREPTEKEIEDVRRLAGEEGKAKDAHEALTQAFAAANERANFFGEQALSAIEKIGISGTRAKDVILDFAKALEKAALQALLLGSGPLAQLFGTQGAGGATGGIFGGLLGGKGLFSGIGGSGSATDFGGAALEGDVITAANGGRVGDIRNRMRVPMSAFIGAPQFAIGGGVPAIVHPGEVILNAAQQRNVASRLGGGGPIHLTHAPVINGTGLSAEQVFSVVQRSQKEFARQIGPIFNDWQRRHG